MVLRFVTLCETMDKKYLLTERCFPAPQEVGSFFPSSIHTVGRQEEPLDFDPAEKAANLFAKGQQILFFPPKQECTVFFQRNLTALQLPELKWRFRDCGDCQNQIQEIESSLKGKISETPLKVGLLVRFSPTASHVLKVQHLMDLQKAEAVCLESCSLVC